MVPGARDGGCRYLSAVMAGLDPAIPLRENPGSSPGMIVLLRDYFFLPAIGFALPLRVRALVCVRWPRTGS